MPRFDAIVLAGGSARRLGGVDKAMLPIGGVPMLARVVKATAQAGRTIVVGPERDEIPDVVWVREDPIGGGPVAAVAAAVPLVETDLTFVLAADQPWIGGALQRLLDALDENPHADTAMLESEGRSHPLAALWRRRSLCDALTRLRTTRDASMRSLLSDSAVVTVADAGGWSRDYDTWTDFDETDRKATR
jgi:molybdopterin-guanine dinucleotide biosynthesis protein A